MRCTADFNLFEPRHVWALGHDHFSYDWTKFFHFSILQISKTNPKVWKISNPFFFFMDDERGQTSAVRRLVFYECIDWECVKQFVSLCLIGLDVFSIPNKVFLFSTDTYSIMLVFILDHFYASAEASLPSWSASWSELRSGVCLSV